MLTGSKFAVAALLLVGSASGAFAQAPYGDNRPVSLRTYGPAARAAYGYGPGWGAYGGWGNSYAYAPGPVARRAGAGRARGAYGYAPGAWGAYAYAPGAWGGYGYAPGAWGAYAYAPGPMMAPGGPRGGTAARASEPSPYDWMKVYEAGKLIGQDPDPNVRMMLSKDFTYQ